jgi:hypothetical protein
MKFTEPDFQVLATRLDKLESQNRRWKLAAILLAVSTSALVLMAAKRADQVDSSTIRALRGGAGIYSQRPRWSGVRSADAKSE